MKRKLINILLTTGLICSLVIMISGAFSIMISLAGMIAFVIIGVLILSYNKQYSVYYYRATQNTDEDEIGEAPDDILTDPMWSDIPGNVFHNDSDDFGNFN